MLPHSYSTELSSVSLKLKEKTSRVALTDKLEQDVFVQYRFQKRSRSRWEPVLWYGQQLPVPKEESWGS